LADASEKGKRHSRETDAPVTRKHREDETGGAEKIRIKVARENNRAGETGEAPAAEGEALKAELETFKQKAEEAHERLLRVSAEFENYKKRMQRWEADYRKYANEALIKELLPVVDNLERAVNCSGDAFRGEAKAESEDACVLEGVEMTLSEILKIFKKFHVTEIEALGKPFDPAYHMAMMQEDSNEHPENTVISEFQKGYMIHDRLLRPAMVVVSKGKKDS